jgi:hypothetical protein
VRRFAVAYFFLAVAALCLSAYCFVQVPFDKLSTEVALEAIERNYIDRGSFNAQELKELDWNLRRIRGNSSAYKLARKHLWQAGVYGFGAFGLFSGLMGFSMLGALRKRAADLSAAGGGGAA